MGKVFKLKKRLRERPEIERFWVFDTKVTAGIGGLVPRSVPRSGENPAVKKSQHKTPLIFFYATPPFSGLALPT
jgi:hypothetical protein